LFSDSRYTSDVQQNKRMLRPVKEFV